MSTAAAVSTPAIASAPARSALMLGALGVVFGDIGTSPIYAFRESLHAAGQVSPATVLGVLSLVFWAVVLVVGIKYVVFVLHADNRGEGGIIALLSLALPAGPASGPLLIAGLAGAALFFGDAMITPAISVLSALEGLKLVTPVFEPYVVPLAAAVLVALFAIQSRGSATMGRLFGPVTAAWFAVLAVFGLVQVVGQPGVLAAIDPRHALDALFRGEGGSALLVLGSVFLALTGAEALYADMGHFGRGAIRVDWFAFVMPALLLNYFGQAALVLGNPAAASDPFFLMFPGWFLIPAVALAAAATVIASQAVISGAFTLVQQAIQFGLLPRLDIRQTSEEAAGQIYVPQMNWLLAAAVLALVFGFGSSAALAAAYGISVAGTMLATTLLLAAVARARWGWGWPAVVALALPFLLLDLAFLLANAHKIPEGGWFPLVVGAAALTLVLVWRRGRAALLARRDEGAVTFEDFLAGLDGPGAPHRVPGTAVYLTTRKHLVPRSLALNLRHNGVLHEQVALLSVVVDRAPRVPEAERLSVEALTHGIRRLELRFGFAEAPDVPAALRRHAAAGFDPDAVSFFLGKEVPVGSMRPDLSPWQEPIFGFLSRNAVSATDYFRIPVDQVVELGTRVEL